MRGNELLDKMELVEDTYVEAAENSKGNKKRYWMTWGALAACLALVIGVCTQLPHFHHNTSDPQLGEIILSKETTAKVSYGTDWELGFASESDLVYLTEEELFSHEEMYAFRGKVGGLTNVTIDFNGMKEARCVATIVIDKVYKGDLTAGETIKMLIPCPIDIGNLYVEDTGIISHLDSGMEGIFMPWIYDEDSYMEMNDATLMLTDLASCGLADGMRWVFLDTKEGLLFEKNAYPGAKNVKNLDEIEEYVIRMLK